MSQQGNRDDDDSEKMAVSYASGIAADHTQTLPSFRELLPPHLHDEIEATSYYTSPHQRSRERPVSSGRELPFDPRPPTSSSHGSSAPFGESHPGMGASQYAPRGPSPMLPSIRDLQSVPDRNVRSGAEHYGADPRMSPMDDRQSYHGAAVMHGQPAYTYPPEQAAQPNQQSNFGIMGDSMDSKNKRRRGNLPKPVTDILRAWFYEHLDHPYPSEEDKQMFMTRTGLSISQISNWFINARRRQLPALRNQMRTGASDLDPQRQSPLSDEDQSTEMMTSTA